MQWNFVENKTLISLTSNLIEQIEEVACTVDQNCKCVTVLTSTNYDIYVHAITFTNPILHTISSLPLSCRPARAIALLLIISDGYYWNKVKELAPFMNEHGLIRYCVLLEQGDCLRKVLDNLHTLHSLCCAWHGFEGIDSTNTSHARWFQRDQEH